MTITRSDYINGNATHEEYYEQFVNKSILIIVSRRIGAHRISRSKPPFNDIPLCEWDALSNSIQPAINKDLLRLAEDHQDPKTYPWSLCTSVCIAKAAARQIKEQS